LSENHDDDSLDVLRSLGQENVLPLLRLPRLLRFVVPSINNALPQDGHDLFLDGFRGHCKARTRSMPVLSDEMLRHDFEKIER
jgi:hypothetical protein